MEIIKNKADILIRIVCISLAAAIPLFFVGCGFFGDQTAEHKVEISHTQLEIEVNQSFTLAAVSTQSKEIIWTSSNEEVAVVDKGTVTGISAGETSVIASDGAKFAVCAVTVTAAAEEEPDGRKLVWSDEFDGNALDTSKWSYQTGTQDVYGSSKGPAYWGNDELQYYTQGDNLKVSNGTLQITAKRENRGDRNFTSARITTRDKGSWTYGYIEAKIQSPTGNGMWPAFWMLPQPSSESSSDNVYGGWAANGEIDIMEAKGRLKDTVDTTIHFGGYWPQNQYLTNSVQLTSDTDNWHIYAVDWRETHIAWYVDGQEVYRVSNTQWWSSASDKESAPFDQPFYILLNLAVGGKYDNYVTPQASFTSATMYVDYVRVYE